MYVHEREIRVFASLGRATFRYRRWFLTGTALVVVFAAGWGTGVFGALGGDGFDDKRSESYRAAEAAQAVLGGRGADVVLLVEHTYMTLRAPAIRQEVQDVVVSQQASEVDTYAT
ncbi:MAG: putative rane protein MmpL family, partial [Dactylosporangium sp.]|nr:putative rane protein MmpL family [Dactylosporangium sp.]